MVSLEIFRLGYMILVLFLMEGGHRGWIGLGEHKDWIDVDKWVDWVGCEGNVVMWGVVGKV